MQPPLRETEKSMASLLSHISAFEYWRLVGTPGFPMPDQSRSIMAPPNFSLADFDWLAGMGLLSYPLHGLTSKKHKNETGRQSFEHFAPRNLPFGSLRSISKSQLIVSPELTLIQIAPLFTTAELSGIICEFCGLFTINDAIGNHLAKRAPLTTIAKISTFADRARGLQGVIALKKALPYALDNSRSPMETAAALLLSMPYRQGGFGLSGAVLNTRTKLPASQALIAGVDSLEPDILWLPAKTCIEYDSTEFHSGEGRIANDARRKNALIASGFNVVTLTASQLYSLSEMSKVAKQAASLMKRRIRIKNQDLFKIVHASTRFDLLCEQSVLRNQYAPSERAQQSIPSHTRALGWADDDGFA